MNAWLRIEETGMASEECMNFSQDHEERCYWAAVFGVIGGMIAVLCLKFARRAEGIEAGGIENQYAEESQKQAVEHDERYP